MVRTSFAFDFEYLFITNKYIIINLSVQNVHHSVSYYCYFIKLGYKEENLCVISQTRKKGFRWEKF